MIRAANDPHVDVAEAFRQMLAAHMPAELDEDYYDRADEIAEREVDTFCSECGGMNGVHSSPNCPGLGDDTADDSPYCHCDLEHTIEELDSGKCGACGGLIV